MVDCLDLTLTWSSSLDPSTCPLEAFSTSSCRRGDVCTEEVWYGSGPNQLSTTGRYTNPWNSPNRTTVKNTCYRGREIYYRTANETHCILTIGCTSCTGYIFVDRFLSNILRIKKNTRSMD